MHSSPERHARVGEAFVRARGLPEAERRAFVASLREKDPALAGEVESLLGSDPGDGAFLDSPLLEPLHRLALTGTAVNPESEAPAAPFLSGTVTLASGVYRIESVLGEGGSSTVYRAEQLSPLRRPVALKVLRRLGGRPDAVARFEAECQTVARMQHAGIATLFDAGFTAEGHPLFIMELVPGVPVTDYCRSAVPALRTRLALFLQIAAAVSHAHQRGVVHRDLKPSNILVAESADGPVVKVIDFGIAKTLHGRGGRLQSAAFMTAHGQVLGTLAYMSPEQLTGDASQVDVRTDIYTLGAVLEEMLTGVPAVDIRDVELPVAVRRIEAGRPERSRWSGNPLPSLPRDLDVIIGKAMAMKPARRYQSVTEFAADIERFLESRPVLARRPGALYITGRFARRHKATALGAAVALLALAGSAVWVVRAQRTAEHHYRTARETATFLLREVVEPLSDHLGARDVRKQLLRRALDQTAAFGTQEAADFDVQHARAVIIAALADLEQEEGNLELAHSMIDEVLHLRRRLAAAAPDDRTRQADLSIAIVRKGDIVGQSTDWRNAMPYYHEALAMDERLIAAEPANPRFASNLAWSYDRLGARHRLFEEYDTALEYFRRNLAWLTHVEMLSVKPDDLARCRASAFTHLAILALAEGDLRGAFEHAQSARNAAEVALGAATTSRLAAITSCSSLAMLGTVQYHLGLNAEAMASFEVMYRDAYPLYLRDPLDKAAIAKCRAAIASGGPLAIKLGDAAAEDVWRHRWLEFEGSLEGWPPPDRPLAGVGPPGGQVEGAGAPRQKR